MMRMFRILAMTLLTLLPLQFAGAEADPAFRHVVLQVDAQGKSYFTDNPSPMSGTAGDPAEPRQTALITAKKLSYMRLAPGFVSPWHTAPVRIHLLILQGTMTVEAGSGETRTFSAGDVIEFGDQTGQGHKSTVGRDGVLFAMVEIG